MNWKAARDENTVKMRELENTRKQLMSALAQCAERMAEVTGVIKWIDEQAKQELAGGSDEGVK